MVGENREIFRVALQQALPCSAEFTATLANAIGEVLFHSIRHEEFSVFRPSISALSGANLFFTQRLAMCFLGVLFSRRAIADMAINDDQSRTVIRLQEYLEGAHEHFEIISVAHSSHVPSIADEARGYVFTKGKPGFAFNGYVIVVV